MGDYSGSMFALPGLLALLMDTYVRVHDIVASARTLHVVHLLYLLTGLGLALDIRLRLARAEPSPQLRLVFPLWLWTIVSVALTGGRIGSELSATTVYMMLFLLIAQAVQSFRALRAVAATILVTSIFLGVIAIIQAWNPTECILLAATDSEQYAGKAEGKLCETVAICREGDGAGEAHVCERIGPLGTTSVDHGRVRYRGVLQDPNELALVLSIALPFAMAPVARRRSFPRLLLLIVAFAIIVPAVVWTKSRTGQLTLATVVAAYLIRKVTWKGILAAGFLAAPILMLGGRSGSDAESSSFERLAAWRAGFRMLLSSPVWGVGKSQYAEHYGLTAHNTFVLEAGELGLVGLVLWLSVLYTGMKIVVLAKRRYRTRAGGELAYEWARALFATLCAMGVGINFLSLAYHPIIWLFLALPGAYYLAVRRHDDEFRVVFGIRDLLAVVVVAILYLGAVEAYLRVRGV
jgi:hypothetical protein